jgi:hypothetical protein
MPLTEREREVTLTVLHRFLNLKEPSPHKLLVRQCKDPKIIEHLMRVGILGSYTGEPVAYLPRPIAFHYSGDAEALRRAKFAVAVTIKTLQNLFEVEVEKENFSPDDVQAHARKIYDSPPSIEEIKLGLFLVAEFPNVLRSAGFNSSRTEMVSLQFNDNIVALTDIDGMWDKHVQYQSRFVEKDPNPSEDDEDATEIAMPETSKTPSAQTGLLVFISHSSRDVELARALIDLLRVSLGLRADQIRCSSVDGYRLSVGVNSESQLREEVNASEVVIGLITPNSLASYFVMFELGARWGANQFLAPVLAGVRPNELSAPLSFLNALSTNNESQLYQLLDNLAKKLGIVVAPAHTYVREIAEVKSLSTNFSRTESAGTATSGQDKTVNVELTPGRGQGEHIFLMVKNLGPKQTFRAQCRVLARRNDPNPQPVLMFDLNWQYGGRDLYLARGQEGNILIATAGEDKSIDSEWMKLEAANSQQGPDSRWMFGAQLLPEYDLEITILGDKSDHPQSERFTVRPGKNCALEMYRPFVRIESPASNTELHKRECRVKGSVGIPRAKVQLLVFAGGQWHPNQDATVKGESWEGTCWLGDKRATRGQYKIIAVANGNIDTSKKYKWLPEGGYRSNEVDITLKRDTVPPETV